MRRGKTTTGHFEMVLCIGAPLLLIAVIAVAGFLHCRSREKVLSERENLLRQIPVLEKQADAARQALLPFVVSGTGRDKAAELSLCASEAAQKYGLVVRTSSMEKQISAEAGNWTDYKLTMKGDGSIASLVSVLDYLEHAQRRFRAEQVNYRTTQLVPVTAGSCEMTLVSRVVVDKSDAGLSVPVGAVTPAQASGMGLKLGQAMAAVEAWTGEKVVPLSVKSLESRSPHIAMGVAQQEAEPQVSFRLTGVIRDRKRPVVMTDKGVFGVGDEIDGFKIKAITEDTVTVVSKSGRLETVRLYSKVERP